MKRDMKVYSVPRRKSGYWPQIRLQGAWLEEAGMKIGDRVSVEVKEGEITIKKEEVK